MITSLVNMELEEGVDYSIRFTYTDPSTSLPIDITSYTAEMFVDTNMGEGGALLTFTSAGGQIAITGASGVVTVNIPGSSSSGLGLYNGFYNLYIISPGLVRTKLSKGFFNVSPSVFG